VPSKLEALLPKPDWSTQLVTTPDPFVVTLPATVASTRWIRLA
jgi:hypothetical protein